MSVCLFLTLEQFDGVWIDAVAYFGTTLGASCCLNSQYAVGEILRRAAAFTLGGQGPLLFARVQCEHLGRPPARIH